jgi:DMSO/TMAO reductase YedYZ molybdopterin-dependent catalytic subunit
VSNVRGARRGAWSLAGVVAGLAGLATSYFLAMAMTIRESPVVSVAELVIRLTPGPVAEGAISVLGKHDKSFLVLSVLLLTAVVFAWAGRLAARSWWAPTLVFAVLAAVGGTAVMRQRGAGTVDLLPVVVGLATWLVALPLLTAPLRAVRGLPGARDDRPAPAVGAGRPDPEPTRRGFLLGTAAMAAVAATLGVLGRRVGSGRRHVAESRRLLRLSGVTQPRVPASVRAGLAGIAPWMTSLTDFYRIHTALVVPAIEPAQWRLRIHGLVDREVVLTYQQLLDRRLTEGWITLNCVSNEVGGSLIGNAWWSGVRLADLLAEAGVRPGADAVLQTSDDGWTCGTPLSALTDDRAAMLAVAMNGEPLPIEHGFPVRTVVPGLYGYVSACKWVVDLEVTRFEDVEAYWTTRGWGERGPVKMSSRIDVPASGAEVAPGRTRVGGVAWSQHTGIAGVELSVDGGAWRPAALARTPTDDAWVQWTAEVDLAEGDHQLRVRATDKDGLVQTGVRRDVLPDGATGWHTTDVTATAG